MNTIALLMASELKDQNIQKAGGEEISPFGLMKS
jgi:hypothetical protein